MQGPVFVEHKLAHHAKKRRVHNIWAITEKKTITRSNNVINSLNYIKTCNTLA